MSSSKNYRRAFESDIFFQKNERPKPPVEKPQFNYKIHPKDKVESLPKYMSTEPNQFEHQSGKKTFNSNPSDILNLYEKNAPSKQKKLDPKHHLSKSQVEMGDEPMEVVHKNRTKSMEKYPPESTPYTRKMEEFYGKNYLHSLGTETNFTTRSKLQREILEHNPAHKTINEQKYASNIGINEPSYDVNNLPKKTPIRVRKADTATHDIRKKPFERKVNFLKSNLFNSPEIASLNSSHQIVEKEKPVDAYPIKSAKRATSMDMNQIFDWRESKNNIWLAKYNDATSSTMSAKQRKLNNIYGSLDHIAAENMKENLLKRFYENKNEIESKAKEQFQGKGEDFYKKQCENISSLNGTDFYMKNYQLNTKTNPNGKEVSHSYEIENIDENDIKQVKKYFTNCGIHVYDTEQNFKMNSVGPGKISVKIRENENDQNFQKNLTIAKEKLKKEKGLELKVKTQPQKNKLNALPQSLQWNDVNLHGYVKNRYEENTDQRTHIKGYGKVAKKEKVTNIPYNLRYKNNITKNF